MAEIPTTWSPTGNQEGEYTQDTVADIVDSSGVFLVDSTSNNVVDGGVLFTGIPSTTWAADDGA